ncbi:hypothetical protein CYLTODRAFT_442869 [Cylindrobasidium torrendii FP15055 ss-10]|uniref:Anaphase-promoting complex subunit 5 n=1 Tax=Cylindrobasidium torrendii FP15055 ss-10 TaxID=1314674 RepID=A0A0D7BHQ8_9AGAR|nr:hypothetical protein CYLTODRAFT_442869 [Cylindrobasidium torrendii FP15055 ss-10]
MLATETNFSDGNPRPPKRQRLCGSSQSREEFALPTSQSPPSLKTLYSLPLQNLLVSLPGLLIHPPTHRHHARSLCMSIHALKACLSLSDLSPVIECRAWTGLAELGMIAIEGGFSDDGEHAWATNMETMVEEAASKALFIASKHPTLRLYRIHITCVAAKLAHWQQNIKFARNMLRQLVQMLTPNDPPHIVYSAHLTLVSQLSAPTQHSIPTTKDTLAAIRQLDVLAEVAMNNDHLHIRTLTAVARLRVLVSGAMWDRVEAALSDAEDILGLDFPRRHTQSNDEASLNPISNSQEPHRSSSSGPSREQAKDFAAFTDKFSKIMAAHTLIIGGVFYSYIGNAAYANPRLTALHVLMDADNSSLWRDSSDGTVEINIPHSRSLLIQTTHPRVLHLVAFLASCVMKKDPVGRKPKRKVFGVEGLKMWEQHMDAPLLTAPWASVSDVERLELTLARLKADILCELVSVHVMRSEFVDAKRHIDVLVAHLRESGLWDEFAARVMMYEAHLAHAQGNVARAETCYMISEDLASNGLARDDVVRVCAAVGLVSLQIGAGTVDVDAGMEVAKSCRLMGGTLQSAGKILESCLTDEILQTKNALKDALAGVTDSGDNHLRALVLACLSSHFLHTASEYALKMLAACDSLAKGMGAGVDKAAKHTSGADTIGNIPLRIWTAERFIQLYRRQGDTENAVKREQMLEAIEATLRSARDT